MSPLSTNAFDLAPFGTSTPLRGVMTTDASLLQFPSEFPLKIMGRNTDDFRSLVLGIVQQHMGAVDAAKIEERPSRDGNYLGLTYTVRAESKAQLDDLYRALTSCEKVLIVL